MAAVAAAEASAAAAATDNPSLPITQTNNTGSFLFGAGLFFGMAEKNAACVKAVILTSLLIILWDCGIMDEDHQYFR